MAQNQRKYDPVGFFFVFWEDCLVSKRMFIPDVTTFLSLKTLYIDTKKAINDRYSVFSATSVEFCSCRRA